MNFYVSRTPDGLREYPLHTHGRYEIMLYLEGQGVLRTSRKEIPFCPGTVVIVPPGIEHGSTSENGFRNVSVGGDFGEMLCFDEISVFSDNERGEGRTLATLLYENQYGNEEYRSSLCRAYLQFLLQNLRIEDGIRTAVKSICDGIARTAFFAGIDLAGLLAASGYSEDYIRARFRQITGKTPHEYLTEIRIGRARFLIDVYGATLPLSEIAVRCGYEDYPYFSKKFKASTGLSPRQYRENLFRD